MNKSLLMAALTAQMLSASASLGRRRTAYTDYNGTGLGALSIDNETDPTSGAGGTEQQVKTDPSEANANSNVITSVAGGGEQMQAQAENASQVGGTEINSADKKVDDSAGTGLASTAIGDPPAGQTQQV